MEHAVNPAEGSQRLVPAPAQGGGIGHVRRDGQHLRAFLFQQPDLPDAA